MEPRKYFFNERNNIYVSKKCEQDILILFESLLSLVCSNKIQPFQNEFEIPSYFNLCKDIMKKFYNKSILRYFTQL